MTRKVKHAQFVKNSWRESVHIVFKMVLTSAKSSRENVVINSTSNVSINGFKTTRATDVYIVPACGIKSDQLQLNSELVS